MKPPEVFNAAAAASNAFDGLGCGDPEHCPPPECCDFCGAPIDGDIHHPHDRDCDAWGTDDDDCDCDNQVCALDCWWCAEEET